MSGLRTVLWADRETGGLDRCVLTDEGERGARLSGTALVTYEAVPYEVRYTVMVDATWQTRSLGVHVQGGPGDDARLALMADEEGRWTVGREPYEELAGCIDADLGVTPATNTIPIRRLGLAVGESADISVVSIRFPDLAIAVEEQRYERKAPDLYRYSSGPFDAELVVDSNGLVLDYEDLWHAVASA
ncbi:MAG TPA: putative glycolipid-binding domain-containing protein [Acidimicrobiales bacterium]|nr:putative glycolipid-binding domain-containing protein [Acidimicrobiales bacterium]